MGRLSPYSQSADRRLRLSYGTEFADVGQDSVRQQRVRVSVYGTADGRVVVLGGMMNDEVSVLDLARLLAESPKLDDERLSIKLRDFGMDPQVAEYALALIPLAFARGFLARISIEIQFSDEADVGMPEENWRVCIAS